MEIVSQQRCFDGTQGIYRHRSSETGTDMQFAVFTPVQAATGPVPVLWYLSGLTCTEENFTTKAGAQYHAARHGLMLVAPDTSPRGTDHPGEHDSYDFGSGAGFYLDATVEPWSKNYRMYSYITGELQDLIMAEFPCDRNRQGITGHSMGGHGALTMGLKNPDLYKSISAFAPICSPIRCPWGQKALKCYLGEDRQKWRDYDSVELITDGRRAGKILVDQGASDNFIESELKPELLQNACSIASQPLELRIHDGYDHSYYFIATFMPDHVRFHCDRL